MAVPQLRELLELHVEEKPHASQRALRNGQAGEDPGGPAKSFDQEARRAGGGKAACACQAHPGRPLCDLHADRRYELRDPSGDPKCWKKLLKREEGGARQAGRGRRERRRGVYILGNIDKQNAVSRGNSGGSRAVPLAPYPHLRCSEEVNN